MTLYEDRREAGRQLSNHVKNKIDPETVVIPYQGACDIGLEIAKRQDADVSLRMSDFITTEDIPHANIGGIVEDGTIWVEDSLKKELGISTSYIGQTSLEKSHKLRRKSIELREKEEKSLTGQSVAIASEGIGSGFREAAVVGSLMKEGVSKIHIVAPFKSRNAMANLESIADKVFCLKDVPFIGSTEACYSNPESQQIRSRFTA